MTDEQSAEDLGSKNGTFGGEERLEGPAALEDGDTFRLGRQLLCFRSSRASGPTRTETVGLDRSS